MKCQSCILNWLLISMAVFDNPSTGLSLSGRTTSSKTSVPHHSSRRDAMTSFFAIGIGSLTLLPQDTLAETDCLTDCLKNCKLIAPKDPAYCTSNCQDYCSQDDRTDGLSGSISAASGEVGILGGTFGQGTVPKGEDRPPSINLPGIDFSSEKGKKLLGL